jgi:hypothetical protein
MLAVAIVAIIAFGFDLLKTWLLAKPFAKQRKRPRQQQLLLMPAQPPQLEYEHQEYIPRVDRREIRALYYPEDSQDEP